MTTPDAKDEALLSYLLNSGDYEDALGKLQSYRAELEKAERARVLDEVAMLAKAEVIEIQERDEQHEVVLTYDAICWGDFEDVIAGLRGES